MIWALAPVNLCLGLKRSAGAKAQILSGFCGPTKVVP